MGKGIAPVHPGEILLEDFLKPMGISQNKLSLAMRVPANRVNEFVRGKRNISAETALRLGLAIGTSAEVWLNLQTFYDLRVAEDSVGENLRKEVIKLHEE
jgi:addiction module HigA family antidote